jgi:AbrB family looped-hinge helix DNA binding protein
MKKCDKIHDPFGADICGLTVLGERGQIVIPKEARHKLGLKAGDRFMVIEHFGKLILVPAEEVQEMLKKITKHLKK